jgi:RNA polymerase sigma-70 factor (ECF subfamily)
MSSDAAAFPQESLADVEVLPRAQYRAVSTASDDRDLDCLPAVGTADDELLTRLSAGDQDALAVIFRRYARAVRGIALRILQNGPEADDLVQEVFLFLFQKASAFNRSRGSARTWILFTAYNRALDRRKYLNSRHFYNSQEFEEDLVRIPEERGGRASQGSMLEEILGRDIAANLNHQLSIDQLETIRLHFFEGHTLKEIAEIMGQSLVNVRNFYYRGLKRIRKTILPAITRSK